VERNGLGVTAWPSDSATSAASSSVKPLPPNDSGTRIPAAPSSASPCQIARSFGQSARAARARAQSARGRAGTRARWLRAGAGRPRVRSP
jgi:hypothetical protein